MVVGVGAAVDVEEAGVVGEVDGSFMQSVRGSHSMLLIC